MANHDKRTPGISRSTARQSHLPSNSSPAFTRDTLHDLADRVAVALTAIPIHGLVVTAFPDKSVRLEGTVRTESDVHDAVRYARIPGVQRIENNLVIDPLVGSIPLDGGVLSPELAAEIELNQLHVASGTEIDLNESVGTTDTAIATDEAVPYFPPTDPPTRTVPRQAEGIEVVDGFAPTSLDAPIDLEQLPCPLLTGDDEIAREVRLMLMDDAATADLNIHVTVRQGVVHLRGVVPTVADAETAEEVASRVPNVAEVVEEFDVTDQ